MINGNNLKKYKNYDRVIFVFFINIIYEIGCLKIGKHFTDRQRLDMVKKYKQSGLNLSEFSRQANISRSTLKDWVNAFTSLQGEFIKIKDIGSEPGSLMDKDGVKIDILEQKEITKKSAHFTRFDHSVVVIEVKGMKITTSLEQALKIVESIFDKL